jgi:hypothetical protein
MRIDASGNVGIGVTAPSDVLTVKAAAGGIGYALVGRAADGYGRLQSYDRSGTVGTGSLAFFEDGTISFNRSNTGSLVENARINTSGALLVGTTVANGNGVTIDGTQGNNFWSSKTTSTAGYNQFTFSNPNGIVGFIQTGGSSTIYGTSSDYRLKENVTPLAGAADRLAQIPVHRFNFIADPDKTVDGFLAHEVQAFVPECVTGEKDQVETVDVTDEDGNVIGTEERPVYQGIDQSKLVPLLTAALQEALADIATLKAEVAALKGSA